CQRLLCCTQLISRICCLSHTCHLFYFSCVTPCPPVPSTLSLHDALPILRTLYARIFAITIAIMFASSLIAFVATNVYYHVHLKRSEEHTSELQSRFDLVCRLLLDKKNRINNLTSSTT